MARVGPRTPHIVVVVAVVGFTAPRLGRERERRSSRTTGTAERHLSGEFISFRRSDIAVILPDKSKLPNSRVVFFFFFFFWEANKCFVFSHRAHAAAAEAEAAAELRSGQLSTPTLAGRRSARSPLLCRRFGSRLSLVSDGLESSQLFFRSAWLQLEKKRGHSA